MSSSRVANEVRAVRNSVRAARRVIHERGSIARPTRRYFSITKSVTSVATCGLVGGRDPAGFAAGCATNIATLEQLRRLTRKATHRQRSWLCPLERPRTAVSGKSSNAMSLTSRLARTLVAAAIAGGMTFSFAVSASAVTVRDHRGMGNAPQPSAQLACGSYKYCAKQGVIVRDHRTGANPSDK